MWFIELDCVLKQIVEDLTVNLLLDIERDWNACLLVHFAGQLSLPYHQLKWF